MPSSFAEPFAFPGLPNRPGTPEIPQKYNNTALVVWRPSDTMAPCTYSLEKRTEGPSSHTHTHIQQYSSIIVIYLCQLLLLCCPGETHWLIVATGVADCYYNVVDLPLGGSFRFRVACVNKAGQGPYSNLSQVISLDSYGENYSTSLCLCLKCNYMSLMLDYILLY